MRFMALRLSLRAHSSRERGSRSVRQTPANAPTGPRLVTLGCMTPGHATAEGTARLRDRFPAQREAGHFSRREHVLGAGELWLSSVGLGTYLGEPDDRADQAYTEA